MNVDLLGIMNHELRSPLTSIKGYAATLLRHGRRLPRAERREFLLAIVEASDRLEITINRMLDVMMLESGSITPHWSPVNLARLIHAAMDAAKQRCEIVAPGQYVFTLRTDESHPPVIQGDTRLLRLVVDNLLENAVKFSPGGGVVEISLREGDAGESAADTIELVVRDRGQGIPAAHLDRIFERYHCVDTRLTRETEGLGLGLAICRKVVDLHGGTIHVDSVPGEGSTFSVTLPATASSMLEEHEPPVVQAGGGPDASTLPADENEPGRSSREYSGVRVA